MANRPKRFNALLIAAALVIIGFVTVLYVAQLNKAISENIISSISEIAEHDKAAIQAYIDICWNELYGIQDRFVSYGCETIEDIEIRMNLECASTDFTHVYMLAEDGTVYTDKFVTYSPGNDNVNRSLDFLPYFADGRERIILWFDDKETGGWLTKEGILYGIRLNNYEIDGVKMLALIGISDISSIQDNMVIDSFIKDGNSRGSSFLIDKDGNYIINVNKETYLNKQDNLYDHLSESSDCELTNEEVTQKIDNRETFSFYHTHVENDERELLYFIPLTEDIDLYFIMSVRDEVFLEQTRTFTTMSMTMLAVSLVTIVSMLLIMMRNQYKTIQATEKARSQKEFLSNMSHEIRTPLNGLIGMNHLIMVHIDDESQKPQIKEWLKKSNSTANYLLSLVNDILDLSKLQAGKVSLINEPLLLTTLIDEIAAMQADNIKSRGVEFIVETDIPEPCVEGDATRIKQILMNIVGNAAKFTPEGKYIRLSVSQHKTDDMHVTTSFRCEDTGIGISPEYIGKIFDSFSQDRRRNSNGIKGTGLGMTISKLLATAMGGDITVESELDVGSTFTVTLPFLIVKEIPEYLKETDQETAGSESTLTRNKADGRPLKILVAEDVDLNAEILLEILALEGFETAHAGNGKEALEMFRDSAIGEFDIILMDMQMPVMDGCTASDEIRRLSRADAGSVLIYACTANTFQEDRDMALKHGMNDFLTKPIDVNILLKKLRNM
ncbi:MAG: response regulator [Lachnospiraceae bacterium]|nr:response regulator [Lachnospiraceae bacterium]